MTETPDFLLLMYPLTHEQRLEAYDQFNRWQWPDALASVKPEGFDSLPNFIPHESDGRETKSTHPHNIALLEALRTVTNEWQRSWHHLNKPSWGHTSGMLAEEHREWWMEHHRQ